MFAQLNTKTVYSFMDSVIDLDGYIDKAKQLGYKTVGIMDKHNMYAAYHFIQKAQKAGLQPVVGLEIEVRINEKDITCFLVAKDSIGYRELMKLSTKLLSEGVSHKDLEGHEAHLAIIIPYQEELSQLELTFSFLWGLTPESSSPRDNRESIALACARYFEPRDIETLHVLRAIRDNTSLRDTPVIEEQAQLMSESYMSEQFLQRHPEALAGLEALVAGIHYQFDTDLKLPRFNRDRPAVEELRELTTLGLQEKGLWISSYQKRLDEELSVIHQMGFDDYFLIVWDLLRFGRSRGYYMGMGRGSAAGSLVAFALDITGIDPVANQLLFERFLNRERFSMPDIDIDLPDIYRSEFLRYVADRYGSRHTAQIVTFSTFGAKQAIRDVFKRFGTPEYELTAMTKKISFRDSLSSVYDKNIAFRQLITSRPEYQKAFDIAKRIEGNPRQTSIHAAGVVMSDDDLTNHIPLKSGEEMMITQYDAHAIEANGLLKMDFLGLRNLTFVQKMKEKVAEDYGVSIDIKAIDLEDEKTLALFAKGRTKGIFQFEQTGAINLLKRIKPHRFEDVVATTSLNRPGASDYSENFIRRRFGQEKIDYLDPSLKTILEPTYGIMLYQEQVMQIAQVYAGFTLGKADLLRRAMSKKDAADMQKMASAFIEGAMKKGHDKVAAGIIFERMAKFAGYGFNRSHAYAYSALAFQLAYFKAHYPDVFYSIMLNYSSQDYITDAIEAGYSLASLSINTIPYGDKIADGKIHLGLSHIKHLPRELAYWIIENRPFESVEDFLTRLPEPYQKQAFLEPLIQIGLFDLFEPNRQKILDNLDHLLVFVNELGSLFAESSYQWQESADYTPAQKYDLEKAILGVGISPHPLSVLASRSTRPFSWISDLVANQRASILVQVERIRIIRTKTKGEQMAFLQVTDTHKRFDVTVFPETYATVKDALKEDAYYYLTGKINEREGQLQMILEQLQEVSTERCWLLVANHEHDLAISEILKKYPGSLPVILHYQESKETIQSQHDFVEKSVFLEEDLKKFVLKTVFQ
ncbi:DNA polymerase III subunit alpha [Streptococcus sp. zg-JUN1979]|uniref:DNA polymerase III subunit alpha n=1 Tax=Streptococcus sp. zg-JUN1979 TaxID=3391450 RepID=UPI0039A4959C